ESIIAVGGELSRVAADRPEQGARGDGTDTLRKNVAHGAAGGNATSGDQPRRHRRVEMPPRDVPGRGGQSHHSETDRERYSQDASGSSRCAERIEGRPQDRRHEQKCPDELGCECALIWLTHRCSPRICGFLFGSLRFRLMPTLRCLRRVSRYGPPSPRESLRTRCESRAYRAKRAFFRLAVAISSS